MEIDRVLQNKALSYLKEIYPQEIISNVLYSKIFEEDIQPEKHTQMIANLEYLKEHQLIKISKSYWYSATAKGIDFITNDGGLSTILNIQTIKLHQETIDFITEAIQQSHQIPNEDKQKFVDQLKELPYETIKHILFELVGKGIENIPNLFQLIHR